MPSKQSSDVIAIELEELVNEIKLNLRLKAAPSSSGEAENQQNPLLPPQNHDQFLQQTQKIMHHSHQQQLVIKKQRSRPSPYHIPCRSWNDTATGQKQKILQKSNKNDENTIEDPYELLQQLIKSNNLVKEAVRRLQMTTATAYSRKQSYFYDSDEDNRSPSLLMMCQLES